MFHQGAEGSSDNFFNGSNYDAKRVYPVVNATLTLTQKGQQDKEDKELATITTCANGWFDLDTELWTDRSYILKATLLNDDVEGDHDTSSKMFYVISTASRAKGTPVSKDELKDMAEKIMASVKPHAVQ